MRSRHSSPSKETASTTGSNTTMGSERKRTILSTRFKTAIYTHKKESFLISFILACITFYFVREEPPARRVGLGAGSKKAGELHKALKAKGDGRAAVAIIRVLGTGGMPDTLDEKDPTDPEDGGAWEDRSQKLKEMAGNPYLNVKYLVQVKSHDYPIEDFQGSVCLLGGNANKHDETPLDTLKRELNEELNHPEWVDQIDPFRVVDDSKAQLSDKPLYNSTVVPPIPGTVRYLGTTMHFQSADLIGKRKFFGKRPYSFMCALYEITLRPGQLPPNAIYPRGSKPQEGKVVLLSRDQLRKHSKYAWGYEHTMERYFGETTVNKQKGTAVSIVDESTWKETKWTPE